MCGIAGFIDRVHAPSADVALRRMEGALRHRGPNDSGRYFDDPTGVGLAHTRLSILDLSSGGAQPMRSASGRYVVAFNGEIYNFAVLRQELYLHGHNFHGGSDTEVLLASVEEWGLEGALGRLIGMFALALLDTYARRLYLVRDRLGEKPLYYGAAGGVLLFASELKGVQAHPAWQGSLDTGAIALLLRHNYIPAPYSIWRNIRKLAPGTFVSVDVGSGSPTFSAPTPYWDARTAYRAELLPERPRAERVEALHALLSNAVCQQMVADVPLGAFLSGGVDSSTIVALMQANASRRVRTFSIGFHESGFDESANARAVAAHLGTEHTELYVTPQDALDLVPRLPYIYDEPFADSSQIPTCLLASLTRQHVTVALSGDGGDELFCGYTRYGTLVRRWERQTAPGMSLSRGLRRAVLQFPRQPVAHLVRWLLPGQHGLSIQTLVEKLQRESLLTGAQTLADFYRHAVGYHAYPASLLLDANEPSTNLCPQSVAGIQNEHRQLMLLDILTYLPDDILAKVDRATMACALEARVPMLDHRVVEFAARIPPDEHFDDKGGKALLRSVLYRYVPPELVDRPKQGFAVPIAQWLRGPLREWAEDLLDTARLHQEGIFKPNPIRCLWQEHLSGRADHSFQLWGVLSFQAWLAAQRAA